MLSPNWFLAAARWRRCRRRWCFFCMRVMRCSRLSGGGVPAFSKRSRSSSSKFDCRAKELWRLRACGVFRPSSRLSNSSSMPSSPSDSLMSVMKPMTSGTAPASAAGKCNTTHAEHSALLTVNTWPQEGHRGAGQEPTAVSRERWRLSGGKVKVEVDWPAGSRGGRDGREVGQVNEVRSVGHSQPLFHHLCSLHSSSPRATASLRTLVRTERRGTKQRRPRRETWLSPFRSFTTHRCFLCVWAAPTTDMVHNIREVKGRILYLNSRWCVPETEALPPLAWDASPAIQTRTAFLSGND